MPRIVPAACLLCFLLAAPARADDLIPLQQKVLANGVTVLVWERPSAGRVGTRMFYRVDVAAERPGTTGLTHMLEHFLFKGSDLAGTTDWKAEQATAETIERLERRITDERNRHADCFRQRDVFADVERHCETPLLKSLQTELDTAIAAQDRLSDPTWYDWAVQGAGGTNSTASTGSDWMKFDIDLPANKLELFMWTERARVERPVFRQFEAEREVVVNQIRGGDNRPDSKFERGLQSMTYEASPYGWSHWFSDITRATREDHWEIFHKYFIPQNAIIVVVGEVKAADVFRMAEAYWGSWRPGRPSPRLRTVEPPPVGQRRLTVTAAAGPHLAVNVPMPAAGHPDAPVFDVLGQLLSGEDGLLAKELVTARQIATSARVSGSPAKYPSHFGIRVDVRANDDLDEVEQGIAVVLARIMAGTIGAEELVAAAGRLTLGLARQLEEIGDAAVTIGAMESIHEAGYLNALPSLWKAVTAADLARVARTYFGTDMQTVGVLRRHSTGGDAAPAAAAARTQLRETGTSPRAGVEGAPAAAPPLNEDRAPRAASVRDVRVPGADQLPEPLAIAENPWNAPPWMAARRPSRFDRPAPTLRHTQLKFGDTGFTPPSPARHLHTLPNGIRSFIVSEPVLPVAQMTVLVDAPALADPSGKEGLASLLASILRRAGTATRSRGEIEASLDRLNAVLTISADQNGTRIHVLSPPAAAAEALSLIGGLLLAPDLASVFEAERERLAIAVGRTADAPVAQARQLFDTALYGADHPVARRPTPASVRAIALDDVRQLHRSRYRADRITLAVSGDVDRTRIERAVADAFGTAAAAPAAAAGPTAPVLEAPKVVGRVAVTKDIDIRQGHVLIGHAGIQGLPDDHAALEVMNYILSGGGFVSRMMKLLRTDTGITSALSGSVEPGRGVVYPYLWRFSGRPETIAQGVRLSLEQIVAMRDNGVSEEEFQAARTAYLDGLVPASYETAHETAERLATKALFGLYAYQAPQYLNYYAGDDRQLTALRTLTREDVNRAARQVPGPRESGDCRRRADGADPGTCLGGGAGAAAGEALNGVLPSARTMPALLIIVAIALGIALSPTSRTTAQEPPTLPSTPLKYAAFAATFEPGGQFTLQGTGWPTFSGTWKAAGQELTLSTAGGPAACAAPGRYRVRIEGTRVLLRVLDDACTPRRMILDASTWRPEGEPEPVANRRIVRSGPEGPAPLPKAASPAESWPSFRGANASGVAEKQNLPERWNGATGENVLWKTPIPGLAHSSPVVWGHQVFVTTAVSSRDSATFKPGLYGDGDASDDLTPHRWMVYAIDRRTGRIAWERQAAEGTPRDKRHIKSTYASASPATDGRLVVAWFGSQGVFAYDVSGTPLWRVDLGRVDMGAFDIPAFEWGPASSPIIWNDLVILQCDTQADSFLLALDARSGRVVWKTDRDELPSWGTPTVIETAQGPVLVANASNFIRGYDPRSGQELWRLGGSSKITAPTPIAANGLIVVASGRRPELPLFAVRAGARGDLTLPKGETSSTAIAWSHTGRGSYMPTPLAYDGILYVLANNGVLDAYDLETGKEIYRQRLPQVGSGFSASPVAADGRIYLSNEDGDIIVIAAGPAFRHIATNPIGELLMATPALSGGAMYVRSASSLFAIGRRGGSKAP